MNANVIKNVSSALKSIGRYGKKTGPDAYRAIQTIMVSWTTKEKRLIKIYGKKLGTSQKILHKHRKFRLKIYANDELDCWEIIYRQPYKDRLG